VTQSNDVSVINLWLVIIMENGEWSRLYRGGILHCHSSIYTLL
jgi:hypothetical protein